MNLLAVIFLLSMSAMTTEAWYYYSYPYSYAYFYYPTVVYGKRQNKEMTKEEQHGIKAECVYAENDGTLKCFNPYGEVKCMVEWKMEDSMKLDKFAIGQFKNKKFNLYPKKKDTWMSNQIKSNGETFNISIHSGESKDYGLMVKETKCFKRLTMLFADSDQDSDQKIHLEDTHMDKEVIGDFSIVVRIKKQNKYEDIDDFEEELDELFGDKKKRAGLNYMHSMMKNEMK